MRDLFYTILIVWVVWRIFNGISSYNKTKYSNTTNHSQDSKTSKEGETKIDYVPPAKKKIPNDDGEYVDYEEIK